MRPEANCWKCPCEQEPPGRGIKTLVSLREPYCPFCGGAHRPEYEETEEIEAA